VTESPVFWGDVPLNPVRRDAAGGLVRREGELFYRISNYHRMDPFLIALVSGSDHWLYISSTGGLTAGRRSPDQALFPYYTDDKIHDAGLTTGGLSALVVSRDGRRRLWLPFSAGLEPYRIERNLYKNLTGSVLIFEEINHDLEMAFTCSWTTSQRYGVVRGSVAKNLGGSKVAVDVWDGLRNLLPADVNRDLQDRMSTLLDAYKQAERIGERGLALYSLSSVPTDRAEPSEALRATVAWSTGLENPAVLLSEDQFGRFCRGQKISGERRSRGRRGAYFVCSSFSLGAGEEKGWCVAADISQDASAVVALQCALDDGIGLEAVEHDVKRGNRRLLDMVTSADGLQQTADSMLAARHFSNTLFNIMRGGVFVDGYHMPPPDLIRFVSSCHAGMEAKAAALCERVDGPTEVTALRAVAEETGDADLERLVLEYLPLTFSRRHGDPSRPWNLFTIDLHNPDGSPKLHYEGNWRDIFQNWQALALAYPDFTESFIARFVNASTADGYNPYRLTSDGFEWEVLDPGDPWSNIGYWGDHQVNYLVSLLEFSRSCHPDRLPDWLSRDLFVYADVPYRIDGYAELISDPRNTVSYDEIRARAIEARVASIGQDGKLKVLADGAVCRANLLEKLLVAALVKLGNFVPGGGIWMNTQRPEWNDANNALVGYGLSVVTLCYLRRFLAVLGDLVAAADCSSFRIAAEVIAYFDEVGATLQAFAPEPSAAEDAARKAFMDRLGLAAEQYRDRVYAGFSGDRNGLTAQALLDFVDRALNHIDHSIARSRRADGLFHSYNLIEFGEDGVGVQHLDVMLEGQVAALASGLLDLEASVELLDALRRSELYRADQNSYLLYPDRDLAGFLEKNVIDPATVQASAWIRKELQSGRRDYVVRDARGAVHFSARFRNAAELGAALESDPSVSPGAAAELRDVYEAVFQHQRFTGRSGAMYKYEGLGCIYWHMVSKLLLAVAEQAGAKAAAQAGTPLHARLVAHFDEIRQGLGAHKQPAEYGAFPADPYSHSPGFTGVQQPGMTGQVKEDIITRFRELGVRVDGGRIAFEPVLLRRGEFIDSEQPWRFAVGSEASVEVRDPCALAFLLCGVPVIYRLAERPAIAVLRTDGGTEGMDGAALDAATSRALFSRDGTIGRIVVDIPVSAVR
jgi:hypothetical protein